MKYLGWIGNGFLLTGLLLAGFKYPIAFAFTCAGESLWVYKTWNCKPRQWDIVVICLIFAVVAAFNLILWNIQ